MSEILLNLRGSYYQNKLENLDEKIIKSLENNNIIDFEKYLIKLKKTIDYINSSSWIFEYINPDTIEHTTRVIIQSKKDEFIDKLLSSGIRIQILYGFPHNYDTNDIINFFRRAIDHKTDFEFISFQQGMLDIIRIYFSLFHELGMNIVYFDNDESNEVDKTLNWSTFYDLLLMRYDEFKKIILDELFRNEDVLNRINKFIRQKSPRMPNNFIKDLIDIKLSILYDKDIFNLYDIAKYAARFDMIDILRYLIDNQFINPNIYDDKYETLYNVYNPRIRQFLDEYDGIDKRYPDQIKMDEDNLRKMNSVDIASNRKLPIELLGLVKENLTGQRTFGRRRRSQKRRRRHSRRK